MAKKSRKAKKKNNPELAFCITGCLIEAASHLAQDGERLDAEFPTGRIRTLQSLKKRWPYLSRQRARTVACAIQLCDINRFLLNTIKINLTAGAMWEWHVTVLVIAVIETLCYEVVQKERFSNSDVKFKKCINILHSNDFFDHVLCKKLHNPREYRNNVHLHIHEHVEMADGNPKRYNDAVKILHEVEELFLEYYD